MNPGPDSPTPAWRRNSGSRPWRTILFLSLLLLGAWAANRYLRQIVAPWTLPSQDMPGMFGDWSGPVTLENGVTGTLVLELADNFDEQEGWANLAIEGLARYCLGDSRGTFEVYGQADDKGTIADLRFRPTDDQPAWLLHAMSSRWEGDQVILAGTSSFDASAAHIARSDMPEPAIVITLQPGGSEKDCLVER